MGEEEYLDWDRKVWSGVYARAAAIENFEVLHDGVSKGHCDVLSYDVEETDQANGVFRVTIDVRLTNGL